MIAITNQAGETLQLFENQNLITEQAVAWLTDDELPAEISYPIDAPLNDHNKRFVGYGYRVDAALPRQSLPVTVQLEGVLYRRCIFAFKVQNGKLNGYLKIDSAEVYDKLRKLTLLEALPDVIRLGTGVQDAVAGVTPNLASRMKSIASLPLGQFPLTFFPIRNEGFWETGFDSSQLLGFVRQGYVNRWELLPAGGYGFHIDAGFTLVESGFVVSPQFYLWWVLERIMALAGYRIESSWLASEEVQRLVIVNQTAMNQLLSLEEKAKGHLVTAGLHLPEMNVSDFLKAIKGRFGLVFGFNANTRTCYMERFVDVVRAGAAIDLTSFQSGSYDTSNSEQKGFSLDTFIDEGDELNKDPKGNTVRPAPYITGKGTQTVSLKAGTTQMIYDRSPMASVGQISYWLVPTLRQAGNALDLTYKPSERYLNALGERQNPIGLKLLSYRGMTTDSSGHAYPLATNSVRDGKQLIVGRAALTLSGRYGSWQQFLRDYYYFRDNTQTVSVPLLLPVAVLAQLQLHRAVALSLEDQIRRVYLINKLQADAPGIGGKALVRLELLSLPSGIDQPALVSEPEFFVELKSVQGPLINIGFPMQLFMRLTTYTITYWADAARTQPAALGNRIVNLRRIRKGIEGAGNAAIRVTFHEESIVAYPATGNGGLLDPALAGCTAESIFSDVISYYLPDIIARAAPIDAYTLSLQLDPGDDYTILT